ncbi:hypothetical protein PVK06_013113 [Gossypium arboreum]|uniref:Uncharacterized protein n=1 Tax=Gossypium arboreum TaxID=29729 RepID=A0ABR0QED9_GOSAR|nr:hypothetical protein PVK06_013113 [Gossypium arboreum]
MQWSKVLISMLIYRVHLQRGTLLADSIGACYIHCDVAKESEVELAIQLAITWKGKLDILFSNAGIGGIASSITSLDMEQVKHLISINLLGKGNETTPEQLKTLVGEEGILLRGKAATVEDVAQTAVFLASDDTGFITAHNLVIDGG